jgi:hypothetical protein
MRRISPLVLFEICDIVNIKRKSEIIPTGVFGYVLKEKIVLRYVRGDGMRKLVGIIGIGMLLITLCFGGCDELQMKSDHVTVNAMAAIYVNMVDENNNKMTTSVDGVTVYIEMTRQGRDRLIFDRLVQGGLCQATGSYDLSEGQWINCTATVQGNYMGYYPLSPATATLSWDTVNAQVNYGAMYHWYPKLTIIMKKR